MDIIDCCTHFQKGSRTACENHRGISLISIASKLPSGLILRRLSVARGQTTRENQAGFRPGRGCIDHIFAIRQILEQRRIYRQPTFVVFLDFKGAFDSVYRNALWCSLTAQGVPEKFRNVLASLYEDSRGRVRAYVKLSLVFHSTSGVRQGDPASPFLFNFVIDAIMKVVLSITNTEGVQVLPGETLTDLEYADDVAFLGSNIAEMQELLSNLQVAAARFGMRLAPSKCKVLLQDWTESNPELLISGEVLGTVDKFTYLGSCITAGGHIAEDLSMRIVKARVAFCNLRHLWRRKDVSLKVKGRVYNAAVRPVLLYASETWPMRVEDVRRLSVFDHRCLRSLARINWEQHISNAAVRRMVFGKRSCRSINQVINLNPLQWLGHVLPVHSDRFPKMYVVH